MEKIPFELVDETAKGAEAYKIKSDLITKAYFYMRMVQDRVYDERCYELIGNCVLELDDLCEELYEENCDEICEKINAVIDKLNAILEQFSLMEVGLPNAEGESFGGYLLVCKIIPEKKAWEYFSSLPKQNHFRAKRDAHFELYKSIPGTTVIENKEYLFVNDRKFVVNDEDKKAKERPAEFLHGELSPDYVVEYCVYDEIIYDLWPIDEIRQYTSDFIELEEDIIIIRSDGTTQICPAGSYVKICDEKKKEYRIVYSDTFDYTYTKITPNKKRRN